MPNSYLKGFVHHFAICVYDNVLTRRTKTTEVEEHVEAPVQARERHTRKAASSARDSIRKSYSQAKTLPSSSRTSSADPVDLFVEDVVAMPPRKVSQKSIFDGLDKIAAACGGRLYRVTPRRLLEENPPPVHYAKDLPHGILDEINSMPEPYRNSDNIRDLFESLMRQNTYEDEPDAPRILLQNEWDDHATPPWEFHYSNRVWLGKGVPAPNFSSLQGCDCEGECNSKTCACYKRNRRYANLETETYDGWPYETDQKGKRSDKPRMLRLKSTAYPVFECNAMCGCSESCINRVRFY